jgi:hypothetical protein
MPYAAKYRKARPGANYACDKRWRDKIRTRVFEHYGLACQECGSTKNPQIDHIAQDGGAHRDSLGYAGSGNILYRWLIKNNFPEGFRTLCADCNELAYILHCRGVDVSKKGFTAAEGLPPAVAEISSAML